MSNIEDIYNMSKYLKNIHQGDILYVISDISRLILSFAREKKRFSMETFVDNLQKLVGREGTLIFPTFNWSFRNGVPYDYVESKSQMGVLSQYVLEREDFTRTLHPIHSFAVWGKYQKYLTQIDPSNSFGENTVFDFMYKKKAKALAIDINSMEGMTFIHHVEKMVGVPFRYDKKYVGEYIDAHRNKKIKQYTMYALNGKYAAQKINRFRDFSKLTDAFGITKNIEIGNNVFSIVDLYYLYELLKIEILSNDLKNLYKYEHYDEEI